MGEKDGNHFVDETVGIVPAAGFASRISPIPCSKEIFPIGFTENKEDDNQFPRVISSYLLESFRLATAETAYMIIRKGKWDILDYYGNGNKLGIQMAYLVIDPTPGVPYTINEAFHFVKGKRVLFGFPDILFQPVDAFASLLKKMDKTDADLVLGLFPASNPQKMDMVELDNQYRVKNIVIKPDKTDLKYTWIIAVWSPSFSEFMNRFLEKFKAEKLNSNDRGNTELFVGDVIREAIIEGLQIDSVLFDQGNYIDIGTMDDLRKTINNNS